MCNLDGVEKRRHEGANKGNPWILAARAREDYVGEVALRPIDTLMSLEKGESIYLLLFIFNSFVLRKDKNG